MEQYQKSMEQNQKNVDRILGMKKLETIDNGLPRDLEKFIDKVRWNGEKEKVLEYVEDITNFLDMFPIKRLQHLYLQMMTCRAVPPCHATVPCHRAMP